MYTEQNDEHARQLVVLDRPQMLVPKKIRNYSDFDLDLLVDPSSGFVVSNGYKAAKSDKCVKQKSESC